MKSAAVLLSLAVISSSCSADIGDPQNTNPAIPPDPQNLAEAAGRYIGSVQQLITFKASKCGYALKRTIPSYEKVVTDELLPAFPTAYRNEAATVFTELKPETIKQSKQVFEQNYKYYTVHDQLDHNTTCGALMSIFISMRKMSAEQLQKKINRQ